MNVFIVLLCIMGAVLISSFLSRFVPKISTPLIQIILGLLLAWLEIVPDIKLDPDLFMVLFIAPLLYLEAHEISKSDLLSTIKISLSLAIGLAIATLLAVGFTLHALWPAIPLAAAFALGAALGPTDAVAVSSLSNDASLTKRQLSVLRGESLFNDASGIIGFQFSILAVTTGAFSFTAAAHDFIISFVGGILFGMTVGFVANLLFETIRSLGLETTTTRILMELFLPFLLYLAAEQITHVSSVLTVVAAGLVINFDHTGIGPNVSRTNIVSSSVWSVLSFSLNGAVFVLLGLLLPGSMRRSWIDPSISNSMLLVSIVLVSIVVIIMRFLWVSAMLKLTPDQHTGKLRHMNTDRWRSAAIMTFGGPKGTITLSLLLTIPYVRSMGIVFPMRNELIFIGGGVIIVTLLLANFLLPLFAPVVRTPDNSNVNAITIEVLRRTVSQLSQLVTDENRRAVLMVIDSYTKRISRIQQRTGLVDSKGFQQLQLDTLEWEKDFVKTRLMTLKEHPLSDIHAQELSVEACERMLDQIMSTLRHTSDSLETQTLRKHMHGRLVLLSRRTVTLYRRILSKIRRTAPLISDNEMYPYMRQIQSDAIEFVINRLYEELKLGGYTTEHTSALLRDYRRAEATLRSRPNVNVGAATIALAEEVKRESYAIELSIIQNMLETGEISRNQARELRRNVYVMNVDADANITV